MHLISLKLWNIDRLVENKSRIDALHTFHVSLFDKILMFQAPWHINMAFHITNQGRQMCLKIHR